MSSFFFLPFYSHSLSLSPQWNEVLQKTVIFFCSAHNKCHSILIVCLVPFKVVFILVSSIRLYIRCVVFWSKTWRVYVLCQKQQKKRTKTVRPERKTFSSHFNWYDLHMQSKLFLNSASNHIIAKHFLSLQRTFTYEMKKILNRVRDVQSIVIFTLRHGHWFLIIVYESTGIFSGMHMFVLVAFFFSLSSFS